jgi:hypothetical protein
MKPRVSDEIKAKLLARVYTDLMPKPPPKPKAEVVEWPKPLSEMELTRRQQVVDACWERTLDAQRELEAEVAKRCHRGPGDPDWEIAAYDPIWGKHK